MIPSPYERQRPRTTVASAAARNSATRRDFPTPADADDRDELAAGLAAHALPRLGERLGAPARARRAASRSAVRRLVDTATSRQAGTGSRLPFSSRGSTGSASTASPARRSVVSSSRISPGCAAACSRAATLTASPVASRSSVPVTTSPVQMPIRPSMPSSGIASCISAAARSARTASSSCTAGTPKTAITASPMNFSTMPPWRSTIAFIRSK